MHSRTPFQFLEPHIVRLIVDNLVDSGDEERLKSLLHVCHNFRAIALPLYFRYYKLILRRRARRPIVRTSSVNKYLGHPTHHLARDLDIELDEKDVYSDAALQILSCEPYGVCAFPFVRRITFFIVLNDNIQTEQSVVVANIVAFVERVKQMAPKASDFRLSPVAYRGIRHTTVRHFDYLATQLFQLAEKAELCFVNGHEYHWEPQLDGVFNLVHIRHTTRHNIPTFIRLARLNARTLESLDIMIANTTDVSSIIQDADGTYISYPRLVTLFLGGGSYVSNLPLPVFEDDMPFPILRRLKIPFMYPVGDDTFFRGNAATLEYLSIKLNRAIVVMLREHSVFTPRSHPSLRRVIVEYDDSSEPGELTSNAEALQFVLSIGTRASAKLAFGPAKRLKVDESLEATVVIKDAFAFAKPISSEDDRDEAKTLKKFRDMFEHNNPVDIFYSKIMVGGRMRFKRGGETIDDTTSTMRIVMESIGKPLRTVKTAKEFVTVICDAMLCHYAIVDKCKILHRDISDNNILVVRMKDDTVRGLLIDFDCAIDLSKEKMEVRGEMTGTFPFISLNNLTCSTVPRTSLDDWESVLYLLCWYTTIGFGTSEDRSEVRARLKNLPIARWRNGTLDTIVDAKRSNLRSLNTFYYDIVRRFDERDKNSKQLRGWKDISKDLFGIINKTKMNIAG
ncbi:hypothetical protein GGI09_000244 [Coemansia sp. S100]|nr:hypothetical protein GGI09_000244 [Coemansia sp. S100]